MELHGLPPRCRANPRKSTLSDAAGAVYARWGTPSIDLGYSGKYLPIQQRDTAVSPLSGVQGFGFIGNYPILLAGFSVKPPPAVNGGESKKQMSALITSVEHALADCFEPDRLTIQWTIRL